MEKKRSKEEDAKLDLILDKLEALTDRIMAIKKGLTNDQHFALFVGGSLDIIQDIERINNAKRNKT